MILLPLAWTLLTVSLWTSGSSQFLQNGPVNVLYPKILHTEVIYCDCANVSCVSVYWFRSFNNNSKVSLQFIGTSNNADFGFYGTGVDKAQFKISKKSTSFALRITRVTEEDTGSYSCVLKDRKQKETWKVATRLLPGVTPPTLPPPTKRKPPVKSLCRCPKKNSSQRGCGSLVLWPLVGLIATLAVALLCVLYYFSRLPKKCRHRFVKRR